MHTHQQVVELTYSFLEQNEMSRCNMALIKYWLNLNRVDNKFNLVTYVVTWVTKCTIKCSFNSYIFYNFLSYPNNADSGAVHILVLYI